MTNCPKQVHQSQQSHGRTNHCLKQIIHDKVIGNILAWDIHKTCGTQQSTTIGGGYFSTTRIRWAELTILVNIMTRNTFTRSNLSVCSAVVNPSFSSMSKRAGESFAASASSKQKPVHCTAMIARKLNADMEKLEATPSVKNCVSKTLNNSP